MPPPAKPTTTSNAGQPGTAESFTCFTAGTLVATSVGLRPIETIRANDRVWSFDLVKGEWRLCRVVQPYSIPYQGTLILITVAGETTEATYQHPYWVVEGIDLYSRPRLPHLAEPPLGATTTGRWVDSCDLLVGDIVLLRDGRVVPVEKVQHRLFEGTVYNMEVDDLHCYTVGQNGVLVHNQNGTVSGPGNGSTNGTGRIPLPMVRQPIPLKIVPAPQAGGAGPVAVGQQGLQAAGITQNTTRIPSLTGTAAYRVPDGLNHTTRGISEVKNVSSLSYTNQLRDYVQWAQANNYTFELWVRLNTTLTGPLQQAVNNGHIVLRFLP